jgi:hypothetical protein
MKKKHDNIEVRIVMLVVIYVRIIGLWDSWKLNNNIIVIW